ncbi:MAG: VOC family protein [Chloroflexota bacterium]|nr:VOC family protein [Chloroflexota bacterium]
MLRIDNVTFDCADPRPLAEFWSQALGFTIKEVSEFIAVLEPPTVGQPNLLFIKVTGPRTAKNRVHLDLLADDREAEVERLTGLGATRRDTFDEYGVNWTVLQDPEGNELCVGQGST